MGWKDVIKVARDKKTTRRIAKIASSILRSRRSSKKSKSVAGSALSQFTRRKRKRK